MGDRTDQSSRSINGEHEQRCLSSKPWIKVALGQAEKSGIGDLPAPADDSTADKIVLHISSMGISGRNYSLRSGPS